MLTGPDICRLMRRHKITIRALALRMDISLKRVRSVRTHGVRDEHTMRDWVEAITGTDPGPDPYRWAA